MAANAEIYFQNETSKVYLERGNKIISFEEYLSRRYRYACYSYSTYALMGLQKKDLLLRGTINLDGWKDYKHGWVEFKFNDKDYVFDSQIRGVISKEDWYSLRNPKITFKRSQEEILNKYLNEDFANKVHSSMLYDIWQLKYPLMKGYKEDDTSYDELQAYNISEGYLPALLSLAQIKVNSDQIIQLILLRDN